MFLAFLALLVATDQGLQFVYQPSLSDECKCECDEVVMCIAKNVGQCELNVMRLTVVSEWLSVVIVLWAVE